MTDRYPPGVPCWIECAGLEFYCALFGWTLEGGVARLDGRAVVGAGALQGWLTYVRGGDDVAARVEQAGGSVLGERRFADPAGAAFGVDPERGAEVVNAPGSWNWSNLQTPDPEAATAFYGAVFGWETSDVYGSLMVRRPGYSDVLEQLDPGIRQRHADFGAPEGFSDAVAWIVAAEGPARWDITFNVDDTDRIASRAEELGGAIAVVPYDEGPTRVAELRDPSGVPFTVSQFSG
jgi:uncharacterized protein